MNFLSPVYMLFTPPQRDKPKLLNWIALVVLMQFSWRAVYAFADVVPYAGWQYVASKLKRDGVQEDLLNQVYNGETVPSFDFVPFKLRPRESTATYSDFLSKKMIERG